MKLKEIEKELDVMESSFKEIVHLAYDNAPDCDEAAMEEFNETMTSEEKAFEQSITALRAALGQRKCPVCGKLYREHPALSRKDNTTEICPACGMIEALKDAGMSEMQKDIPNFTVDESQYTKEAYSYGMRLRGFSPGCQPMKGLLITAEDTTGSYHCLLLYDRLLSKEEVRNYELDYLGKVNALESIGT